MLFRPPWYSWALLALCAMAFLIRGPIRAVGSEANIDAPLLLSAAATWHNGGNPYNLDSIRNTLGADAAVITSTLSRGAQAFVYSPPAYAFLGNLTYLPWSMRLWVWNWLNAGLFFISLLLICKIAWFPVRSLAGFAILAIGLASYPGQLNIQYGQTAILMLFLMSLSWYAAPGGGHVVSRQHLLLSSLAMGLAAVIKPQIVLVFMAGDLYTGRRTVALGAAVAAVVLFFGAITLHGDPLQITLDWVGNMRALMDADANPLTRAPNHVPHLLINLQSPIAVLTGNRTAASVLALLACFVMAWRYVWVARHTPLAAADHPSAWLNALSAASVLMLLVFYHRAYDSVFLMIPVAFAIRRVADHDKRGWVLLALLALPLLASYSYAFRLLYPGTNAANEYLIDPPRFVEAIVIQHQSWLLVAVFLMLCEWRRRPTTATSVHGLVT
jgi:Glycosyltransferase family 87